MKFGQIYARRNLSGKTKRKEKNESARAFPHLQHFSSTSEFTFYFHKITKYSGPIVIGRWQHHTQYIVLLVYLLLIYAFDI